MIPTRSFAQKKNLLLAFDAFGTLFAPKGHVTDHYAAFARHHGIDVPSKNANPSIKDAFRAAYKHEFKTHPNYGKAVNMGAEQWWANVIKGTLSHYLKPKQSIPHALVNDLLTHFSTSDGYTMPPDVMPFFKMLRAKKRKPEQVPEWMWDNTIVGVITNSDDRVPSILESLGLTVGPRRVGTSAERKICSSMDDDISFVVLSYDVGYQKPDKRIFDAAIEMGKETLADGPEGLDIQDFEKLYVGDSIDEDYHAAQAAGWNACLLERSEPSTWNAAEYDVHHRDDPNDQQPKKVDVIRTITSLVNWSPSEPKP
ncbi:uncharacterized protein EI97DRAFT_370056 [Westerdykella ornata]|uniref:Haloacid dehalogenase n=1 Tax=Westerdykella ornata TaxID=318751 RepID=A0A6A6JYZ0_WESOR|nr:uncharacterized protein EI97DRAFT_370056 [Westerdykella ornata]KAF2280259.1 hypothetical protein EI97DRAFT_370056 [Westerdykella ornata]